MASAPAPLPTRASLAFVVLVVVIDMIGFGIVMPVFPDLIVSLTGKTVSEAAVIAGQLALVYALMQFVFGPIVGNLSDRYGRRPVLLLTLLGYGGNYLLMGFAPTLIWLFAGRLVAGIMGASFSVAYSYVADISPPERRAQNFGLVGMAFGLGFILGPAIGGLLGEIDTRLPFFAAGGLALANAVFGFFFLRESLSGEKRRPFALLRSNAVSALRSLGERNRVVLWYAASLFFWLTAHLVYPIIWAFYTIEAFGWSEWTIGLSLAFVGLAAALVQGGLIRIVVPRFGEHRAAMIGFASVMTGLLIYTFNRQEWVIWIAIPIGAMQGLVQPSINGLMSRAVSATHQGELQGAVASLSSLAAIIGPPLFTLVFAAYTAPGAPLYLPGAPFGVAAMLVVVAILFFARATQLHFAGEGAEPPVVTGA